MFSRFAGRFSFLWSNVSGHARVGAGHDDDAGPPPKLSSEQKSKVNAVLAKYKPRLDTLRAKHPEIAAKIEAGQELSESDQIELLPDPKTQSKSSLKRGERPYNTPLMLAGGCGAVWAHCFLTNTGPLRLFWSRRLGKWFLFTGMVTGLTDPMFGTLLTGLVSAYASGLMLTRPSGGSFGGVARLAPLPSMALRLGASVGFGYSAYYHLGKARDYYQRSYTWPYFKHDFPRKDYKGPDD